jgi:GR25 family glycosyltransferase involved in LPS biosynthesis
MKAVFINLETAEARRAQIEAGFAGAPNEGWKLTRFSAVRAAEVEHAPGSIEPAEKACFESHRRLIAENLGNDDPLFVLEDDAAFSSFTFPFLERAAKAPGDWDVLFTDVAFLQLGYMVKAARDWDRLVNSGQVEVVPLQGSAFVGSTAYLVRGTAKTKLHKLLQGATAFDAPYDIFLRDLVAAGTLKAAVCLPFLTSLAVEGAQSQIRESIDPQRLAFDEFRRLVFVERDLEKSRPAVEAIRAQVSEADQMAGLLLAAACLAR